MMKISEVLSTEMSMYVLYGASITAMMATVMGLAFGIEDPSFWIMSLSVTILLLISVHLNKRRVKHENQSPDKDA
jgi:uncharacterized membrane protein